jgi:hypothetical protein
MRLCRDAITPENIKLDRHVEFALRVVRYDFTEIRNTAFGCYVPNDIGQILETRVAACKPPTSVWISM